MTSAPLDASIRRHIDEHGPMTVATFMAIALQDPDHGYYRHADAVGKGGDFITAPEISQMFGEMIGLCLVDTWHQIGRPSPCLLLELGPGRGTLMQDALRATRAIPGFHDAVRLHLLDSNPTLRRQQADTLAAYDPVFLDRLEALPPLPLLAVANEFFDALPVRQFVRDGGAWRERLVGLHDDRLAFTLSPPDPAYALLAPSALRDAPDGATFEISPESMAIAGRLASHISAHGGLGLIIDYGYAAPPGLGTVQAVAGHRMVPVLDMPGQTDLSAHVDFAALGAAAARQGAAAHGPEGQGAFLKAMGIEVRAQRLMQGATSEQSAAITAALHRLTAPEAMGTLFKALALTPPNAPPVAGF